MCSSLIQSLSKVRIEGEITCQAMCPFRWAYPAFPEAMQPVLIDAAQRGRLDDFRVPDREVRLGRFSINAIGFFGAQVIALGDLFHPPNQNEEEWLSAILPTKLNRPGKILGDLLVSHFSFYRRSAGCCRPIFSRSLRADRARMAGFSRSSRQR